MTQMPAPPGADGSFEALFSHIAEAAMVAVDDRIVAVNPAACVLCGVAMPGELVGRPVEDLLHPWVQPGRAAPPTAVTLELAGGRTRPAVMTTVPIVHHGDPGFVVLLSAAGGLAPMERRSVPRQPHNQVFAEVSLQLASAMDDRLDRVIEHLLHSIAVSERADRAFVEQFTDGEPAIVRTHEWCGAGVVPGARTAAPPGSDRHRWSAAVIARHEVINVADIDDLPSEARSEQALFRSHGVRSVLQVPMVAGGTVIGSVGFHAIHRKVTWSLDTVVLLRGVCDALGAALMRRKALHELERARQAAVTASEHKSAFVARMSHELRTPLNSVLGYTELLMTDPDRSDRDREILALVHDSGFHLLSLIGDILDVSAIEAGGLSIHLEPVDVDQVLAAAIAMLSGAGRLGDLELRLASAPGSAIAFADRQRIQQVLLNVISNACKYNRPGGSVEVEVEALEGAVRITVSDSGVGIAPDDLPRVFEPFERLGQETSGIEGSGIGLALARMLLGLMGGTIEIASTFGVGTQVRVRLPAAEGGLVPTSNDLAGWAAAHPAGAEGRGALLVESNRGSALLLRRVMESVGEHDVHHAASLAEANDHLTQARPRLLIVELDLVDGSGAALVERVRSDPDLCCTAVIVVTATADPWVEKRLRRAGVDGYLVKPVSPRSIREAILQSTRAGRPSGGRGWLP